MLKIPTMHPVWIWEIFNSSLKLRKASRRSPTRLNINCPSQSPLLSHWVLFCRFSNRNTLMHALKSETENESELAGTHANALAAVVLTHTKPLAGKNPHLFMWAHTHTHTRTLTNSAPKPRAGNENWLAGRAALICISVSVCHRLYSHP